MSYLYISFQLFFSDRVWGSCAQEARRTEGYEFANNSMPQMNTQPVHVAQFPQYRSTMSNQQMMATMKGCNNANATPNRNSNDLAHWNRNEFPIEEAIRGHFGSINKRDEPIWPTAIYSTQLGKKPAHVSYLNMLFMVDHLFTDRRLFQTLNLGANARQFGQVGLFISEHQ